MVRGTNASAGSSCTGWYTTCQRSSRSRVAWRAPCFDAVWYTTCQHTGRVTTTRHAIDTHSREATGSTDCCAALHQLIPSGGGRGIRRGLRRSARPERPRAPLARATSRGAPLIGVEKHVPWLRTRCAPLVRSARRDVPWRSRLPSASSRCTSIARIARGPPGDAADRFTAFASRKSAGGQPYRPAGPIEAASI
jgi:hypothetical protein